MYSNRGTHISDLEGEGVQNYFGGGGDEEGGYYFANSLATLATSHPTYSWYPNQTGGSNEGTLIADTDFVNGNEDNGHTNLINIFDDSSNFNFFGINYTQMYLSTNGTIGFGDDPTPWHAYTFQRIPSALFGYNNMIAWCWDNLDYDSDSSADVNIRISRLSDRSIITFWHYPNLEGTQYITAQVVIFKNGNIFIMYNDDESTYDSTQNDCSIGIENADGSKGVNYRYDEEGGPIFGSNLALAFGQDESTLPAEILSGSFTASYTYNEYGSNYISIDWTTLSENDVLGWFIYRNSINDLFTAIRISSLIEGYGSTTLTHVYSYNDYTAKIHPGNVYYYWLEMIDFSGNIDQYNTIAQVVIPDIQTPGQNNNPIIYNFSASPNPFSETTSICITLEKTERVDISVYDITGRLIKKYNQLLIPSDEEYFLEFQAKDRKGDSISNGIYLISLSIEGKPYKTEKIILVK
ncbi:MAG: T9SS type A sorting domain-containing protein [Candidatus Cloacimonetes bacterium]|nr:T9SS type A sorting domain-containing protein [Candidatus Cloacimonadota bacterium]